MHIIVQDLRESLDKQEQTLTDVTTLSESLLPCLSDDDRLLVATLTK